MGKNYEPIEERLVLADLPNGRKCIIRRKDAEVLAVGSEASIRKTAQAMGFGYDPEPEGPKAKRLKTTVSCASSNLDYAWLRTELCISTRQGREVEPISNPEAASRVVHRIYDLKNEHREVILVLAVDPKLQPLALHVAAKGGLASAPVHVGEVLRPVLLLQAPAFFLFHNHPSGVAVPSADDHKITGEVKAAAATLKLTFRDHIILTADPSKFYSFFAS